MEQNQNISQPGGAAPEQQMVPKSIAVLILGITALIFGLWGIFFVTAIIGLILGIITLILSGSGGRAIAANPDLYTGGSKGMRKTGKILGLIGLILSGIFIIVWIILLAAGGGDLERTLNHMF